MITLSIKDWDHHFESASSRKLKAFTFAPVPIRQGSFYVEMMMEDNRYELYACWCQILCMAAASKTRGVLVRGNGKPHTAATLAHQARMDVESMERTIEYAVSNGRIIISNDLPLKSHSSATQIPFKSQTDAATFPNKEGRKERKKEGRNRAAASPPQESPPNATRAEKATDGWLDIKMESSHGQEIPAADIRQVAVVNPRIQSGQSADPVPLPALSPADIIGAWNAISPVKADYQADQAAAGRLSEQCTDIAQVRRAVKAFVDDPKAGRFPLKTFAKQFSEYDKPPKSAGMEAAERDAANHRAAIEAQEARSVSTDNLPSGIQDQLAKLRGAV